MTNPSSRPVRISLLAVPDTYVSSLAGFYDTFNITSELALGRVEFAVEIVAQTETLDSHASGSQDAIRDRPRRLLKLEKRM